MAVFRDFYRVFRCAFFALVLCFGCGSAMAFVPVTYSCGAGSGTVPNGQFDTFFSPYLWPSNAAGVNLCTPPNSSYTFDGWYCCRSDGGCATLVQPISIPAGFTSAPGINCTAMWTTGRSGPIGLDSNRYASQNDASPVQSAYRLASQPGALWGIPGGTDLYEYNLGWGWFVPYDVITDISTLPLVEGWTFQGFYTGKNGSGTKVVDYDGTVLPAAASYIPASGQSTTWYAHWATYPVNLEYDCGGVTANGSTNSATPSTNHVEIKHYGDSYNFNSYSGNNCSLNGYSFTGWKCSYTNLSNNSQVEEITNQSGIWTFGSTVTCVAQWQPTGGALIILDSYTGVGGGTTDTLFVKTTSPKGVYRNYSNGNFSSQMDPLPNPTNMVTPPSNGLCYSFAGYYEDGDFDSDLCINSYGELTVDGRNKAISYNSNTTWHGLWGLCYEVIRLDSTGADAGGHGTEFIYYDGSTDGSWLGVNNHTPYLNITNCNGDRIENCTAINPMSTSANPITVPTKSSLNFAGYYSGPNGTGLRYIDHQGSITDSGLQAVNYASQYNSDSYDNIWYAYWCPEGYWPDDNGVCINEHCKETPLYPFWDSDKQKCYWMCPDKGALLSCPDNSTSCGYVDSSSTTEKFYYPDDPIPDDRILCETEFKCDGGDPDDLFLVVGADVSEDAQGQEPDYPGSGGDTFSVSFPNYSVKGRSTCRDFVGNNYSQTWLSIMYMWTRPTSALSSTSGKYCWCQTTGIDDGNGSYTVASGLWTFAADLNDMATCEQNCAYECANEFSTNSNFRQRMYDNSKYCSVKYNVIYDCGDGNAQHTYQNDVYLQQLGYSFQGIFNTNLRSQCSKPGYSITGLSCVTNGNQSTVTQSDADPWTIQDDVTCTAQWTQNTYHVVYQSGDHGYCTYTTNPPNPESCTYNSTCSVSGSSSIVDCNSTDGYIFQNSWQCVPQVGQITGFPRVVNAGYPESITWNFESDLICTAQWNAPQHVEHWVTYDCGTAGAGTNNTPTWSGGYFYPPASSNWSLPSSVTSAQCDTSMKTLTGWTCAQTANPGVPVFVTNQYTILASHLPDADITCTAQWQQQSTPAYTLNYVCGAGGGSGYDAGSFAQNTSVNTLTASDVLSNGYCTRPQGQSLANITSWNCGGTNTNVTPGDSITITGDTTCTAQWTNAITYKCGILNSDAVAHDPTYVQVGTSQDLTNIGPDYCTDASSLGYTFNRWKCCYTNDGSLQGNPSIIGTCPANTGNGLSVLASSWTGTVCEAQWDAPSTPHDVTFAPGDSNNNGTGTVATGTTAAITGKYENDTITLPANDFTAPTGYYFNGWNCDNSIGNRSVGATFTMPAANVICTAQWALAPTYNVTYHNCSQGGAGYTDPSQQTFTTSVQLASACGGTSQQSTYAFSGWYCIDSSNNGTAFTGAPSGWSYNNVASDINCYAVWELVNPCGNGTENINDSPNILGARMGSNASNLNAVWSSNTSGYYVTLYDLFNPDHHTSINQSTRNAIFYNQNNDAWVVDFEYHGLCSSSAGIPGHAGTPDENTNGDFCWCRIRGSANYPDSYSGAYPWVFSGKVSSSCTGGLGWCDQQCMNLVNNDEADATMYKSLYTRPICDYTITFDCNNVGATGYTSTAQTRLETHEGGTTGLYMYGSCTPKTGYVFKQWNCSYTNTPLTQNEQFTMPFDNVTCTAEWKQQHQITYHNGNCKASSSFQDNPVDHGSDYTIDDPNCVYSNANSFLPTNGCTHFIGWSTSPYDSTQSASSQVNYGNCDGLCASQTGSCGTIQNVTADVNLYAICDNSSYNVTYSDRLCVNGAGSTYTDLNQWTYGSTYTVLANDSPLLSNLNIPSHSFQGWVISASSNCDGDGNKNWCACSPTDLGANIIAPGNVTAQADYCSDINLFAVCCPLNLNWDTAGGSWPLDANNNELTNQSTCIYGSIAGTAGAIGYGQTPLRVPVRTGYTFNGWKVTNYGTP